MDYQKKLQAQLSNKIFLAILVPLILALGLSAALSYTNLLNGFLNQIVSLVFGIFLAIITSIKTKKSAYQPIKVLSEAINHASQRGGNYGAPNTEQITIGRELITNLTLQIYNMASNASPQDHNVAQHTGVNDEFDPKEIANVLLNNTPTPLVGTDSALIIRNANSAFLKFIEQPPENVLGKSLNEVLHLEFPGEDTLEGWLEQEAKNSVVATHSWDRVRTNTSDGKRKQFDLVSGYSSDSSSKIDLILSIFDHSERYNQDDQEISFVALAVHELRTPLTVMRGYIEVFEDELSSQLNPEMTDFLKKMQASAQQLTKFVGNILNVARVQENQLALKLREEDTASMLQSAISDLQLRASVHNKTIQLTNGVNLPPVGADRISVYEIINNLVDNAIKYSGNADKISVRSFLNEDGLVQIDVQDYGIGIPTSVMPSLFEKYHRSHKSSVQVGGTGLGLYLCKALVTAQGGNIWVRSKEGQGATFSFTLLPYSQISNSEVDDEDGIIRGAHGWIKNHSLYRN